jgi:hypothetical protein
MRDRDDRDGRPFPVSNQVAIALVQTLLGPPGVADDAGRLALYPVAQRAGDGGPVAIVPGGFDQHAPRMPVARLSDSAPAMRLRRGVFTGAKPK